MFSLEKLGSIYQTHFTILKHELCRDPSNELTQGALLELETLIKQIGGKIVDGKVIYEEDDTS